MSEGQRLDRWLWFCRFVKSRSFAQGLIEGGAVRVNKVKVDRCSHLVKGGDVVTLAVHGRVMAVRVLLPGVRRGPPVEARTLYELLTATGES